jgi:tRNA-dihydrouridine synthase B
MVPMKPYFIRDIKIDPPVTLAPMEGVTNIIFRRLIRQIGGTGLTCTEFIPSSALSNRGKKVLRLAEFDPEERPISIQIYGKDPMEMAESAKILQDLGANIVDINMGCPSKQVCANSGGSALMREPELAIEIVKAVRKAITIPMTVKMRSGFDHTNKNAPELAYACQEEGAEAIAVHWRTRDDKYGGIPEWNTIAEVKRRVSVPVIGNGDVVDVHSAIKMFERTGCDGVMIGRGSMKNPWCMLEIAQHLRGEVFSKPTAIEKRDLMLLFLNTYYDRIQREKSALGKFKQIAKYFVDALPDAKTFRSDLLRSQSIESASEVIHTYFSNNSTISPERIGESQS